MCLRILLVCVWQGSEGLPGRPGLPGPPVSCSWIIQKQMVITSLKALLGLWALQVHRHAFACYFANMVFYFCWKKESEGYTHLFIPIKNKDAPSNGRAFQSAGMKLGKLQICSVTSSMCHLIRLPYQMMWQHPSYVHRKQSQNMITCKYEYYWFTTDL